MLYRKLLRPILFSIEPEEAHDLGTRSLETLSQFRVLLKVIKSITRIDQSPVNVFGLRFPNCIGQAAGLDKDGIFPAVSEALGFGHVEVGTVTPKAQSGNDKPRLFRYHKEKALVNRMGFNNMGVDALVKRIETRYPKKSRAIPLGINLGKGKSTSIENALADYCEGYSKVHHIADYVTINISSPNTPDLRKLHQSQFLDSLLSGITSHRDSLAVISDKQPTPCLLKISPDESFRSLEYITQKAVEYGFDGIIACNTSIYPWFSPINGKLPQGGISGKPIETRCLEVIRFISKITDYKFPIIGSGGIMDYDSALRRLDGGACMLQIYTSFIYNGPFWPYTLAKRIATFNHRLF